jgi:anti-sigma regulatory factor (Ser/Thr protein kinase)
MEARRFVREAASDDVSPQTLDDAMLLSSELVTNAVRHAGRATTVPIEVTVSVDDRSIKVTVRDGGPGFDPDRRMERTAGGGWGLHLVRALSSRWGVEGGDTGTEVWFEIDQQT